MEARSSSFRRGESLVSDRQAPIINVLPARHGLTWLAQSLALVRAQPGRLLFLVVLLQLILGLARVPVLGLLVVMAMPAFSAGLLQAIGMVSTGQRPSAAVLFAPLLSGQKTGRLLLLGALMFLVGILTVSLMLSGSQNLLDADVLARIEQGDMEAVTALDPTLISRALMAIAVGVSISGTLSFLAIPLLWFGDQKLGAALLGGLRAMLMNWRPFTVLALGLMGLLVPVGIVVALLFQLAGSSGGLSIVLLVAIMLIALVFQLAVFGTQFFSYREIYGLKADDAAGSAGGATGDHQLLA